MNRGIGDASYFRTWYLDRDWRFYRPFLADILQHSDPGPILDVGAGLGYLVEAAQRWGLSCCGIEGSHDAVEMALARYPALNLRAHRLSDPFPFEDDRFSAVVFNQVIEHLEADVGRHAVREIYRVLRPNGMLLISSPSVYNAKERREDPTHIHMYAPTELQALLRGTGFAGLVARDEPLDVLGTTKIGRRIMHKIFKLLPWDRFSASANVLAYKAGDSVK